MLAISWSPRWPLSCWPPALPNPTSWCRHSGAGCHRHSDARHHRIGDGAVEVISTGLAAPWSIAFLDDTPLVSERDSGRVLELDGEGNGREIATIAGVVARGEGGLLGIAVHDGYLYAYFTASGENRVERFELIGEPGALSLGEAETILDGLPAAGVHNGGRIAFGPDGMLYVTAGDANDRASAQSLDALSGKILRLTPSGDVPDDNPFAGSPVYSYGHRNPQGIAWDAEGTLYASEFGQNTWDELNIIEPGATTAVQVEGIAGQESVHRSGAAVASRRCQPQQYRHRRRHPVCRQPPWPRLRAVPSPIRAPPPILVGEYGRLPWRHPTGRSGYSRTTPMDEAARRRRRSHPPPPGGLRPNRRRGSMSGLRGCGRGLDPGRRPGAGGRCGTGRSE